MLVALGVVLRVLFALSYSPGFLGYPDSAIYYLPSAAHGLFDDQWHLAGYAGFLKVLHLAGGSLALTVDVQHLLGVVAAILLYGAVCRLGAPRRTALLGAGVVLLGGDEVLSEHAVLSEALFIPLVMAALYAVAIGAEDRNPWWLAAAGALTALAGTARLAGLALIPIFAAWVLLIPHASGRGRLVRSGVVIAGSLVVVAGYLTVSSVTTGHWSVAPKNGLNLYARAATFADCRKFTPPTGTDWLCDATPRAERHDSRWYIVKGGPLIRRYGAAQRVPDPALAQVGRFTRAALTHQPLDWLGAVSGDFGSYVDNRGLLSSPGGFAQWATSANGTSAARRTVDQYYGSTAITSHDGLLEALRHYARATRLTGVSMVVLLVLSLLSPFVCRGRARRAAILLAALAYTIMVVPLMTLGYDGRFGLPAYGPLAAAAALCAHGTALRVHDRRARLQVPG